MGKKFIVASISVIGLICGFCGLAFAIKSKRERDDRDKTSNTNTPQMQESDNKKEVVDVSSSQASIPEGILEDNYDSADLLLKDVLYYFISQGKFSSPNDLLEKTIRACGTKMDDFDWYEQLPKNTRDLEDKIDEFEYTVIYQIGLLKAKEK